MPTSYAHITPAVNPCRSCRVPTAFRAYAPDERLYSAILKPEPDRKCLPTSQVGSQYTSLVFTRRCRLVGIEVSMGSRGDCFDCDHVGAVGFGLTHAYD